MFRKESAIMKRECGICGKDLTGVHCSMTQDNKFLCRECKKKAGGFGYNASQKLLSQIKVDIAVREKKRGN